MSDKSQSWKLYLTAKTTGQRPSDLVEITDRWAALQFDNAITFVGNVIENAAQEMVKVGGDKDGRWEQKYSMSQLLDQDFRLPRPKTREEKEREAAKSFMGLPGVRVVKAKKAKDVSG